MQEIILAQEPDHGLRIITITLPEGKYYSIRLNNVLGVEMMSMKATRSVNVDVSRFPKDTYLLSIYTDQETSVPWIGKILVQ